MFALQLQLLIFQNFKIQIKLVFIIKLPDDAAKIDAKLFGLDWKFSGKLFGENI